MLRSLLAALAVGLPSLAMAADTKQDAGVGSKAPAPVLVGLDGKAVSFDALRGKTATVVVFVSFECPVSNSYSELLNDLAKAHAEKGVSVVLVCPTSDAPQDVAKAAAGFKLAMPVVVDPKGDDYSHYRRATLLTPNRKEFEQVAGKFRDNAELERKAAAMVAALDLDALLVTRSEEGMSLVHKNGQILHMPARAREVFDVTGAGDSVIATIGCAVAAGGLLEDALQLANIAAGIVVGKLGAATASPQEILHELHLQEA